MIGKLVVDLMNGLQNSKHGYQLIEQRGIVDGKFWVSLEFEGKTYVIQVEEQEGKSK